MTDFNARPLSAADAAAALVRRRAGLVFPSGRRPAFDSAFAASMRRSGSRTPAAYLARLESDPAVLDDLIADITVGETYFFRNPRQLDMIREQIFPEFSHGRPGDRSIRVWSAGCATGEEAFTLAILLREGGFADQAYIIGTDISRGALAAAREANFSPWSLRSIPDRVRETYFHPDGGRFVLDPVIRDAVAFRYLNLAQDAYPAFASGIWGMDLVVCRNVMIYFDKETVARVASQLLESLSDSGWLVLGASDPILSELAPCDVRVTDAGLAYRRKKNPGGPSYRAPSPVVTEALPISRDPLTARPPSTSAPTSDFSAPAPASLEPTLPPSPEALEVERVRTLARSGRLSAAATACSVALDTYRMSAELNYMHAALLSEGHQPAAAVTAARRALYLDPAMVVAHLALGTAMGQMGENGAARVSFENALRLLSDLDPATIVPSSDGESAGRLLELVRIRLDLLEEAH